MRLPAGLIVYIFDQHAQPSSMNSREEFGKHLPCFISILLNVKEAVFRLLASYYFPGPCSLQHMGGSHRFSAGVPNYEQLFVEGTRVNHSLIIIS